MFFQVLGNFWGYLVLNLVIFLVVSVLIDFIKFCGRNGLLFSREINILNVDMIVLIICFGRLLGISVEWIKLVIFDLWLILLIEVIDVISLGCVVVI